MDRQEARKILALFRPDSADEVDPAFQEARQWAKTDPELAQWYEAHCEAHRLLRQNFRTIPVPPGLKEQIISEQKIHRPFFRTYWRQALAAAAVVALLASLQFGLWPSGTDRFASYRKRMTEMALRTYYMDLLESDPVRINRYLKEKKAPADYTLPEGLSTTAKAVGCAVSSWQGCPVSMICFKTGRPLPAGDQSDLWLFVIDRPKVPNAPLPGAPVFARVNKATTVSWSDSGKTYLLAAVGDEDLLRNYIQ
jgi:hypothetical protein